MADRHGLHVLRSERLVAVTKDEYADYFQAALDDADGGLFD